jgi:SAM-dependent methyltransferase
MNQTSAQDKQAEIDFFEKELKEGVWTDSRLQKEVRQKQINLLKPFLSRNQLILDAACGPGTYGIILALEGNSVIGVDISAEAVKVAKNRAKKEGCDFLPIAADLEKLPFKNDVFDICFFGYALHHFPDVSKPMLGILQTMKPASKVAILEPNGSNPFIVLSGCLENMARRLISNLGLDTSNETLYGVAAYTNLLLYNGFTNVKVLSHYFGGLPPFPQKSKKGILRSLSLSVIHFVVHLRRVLFLIANKIFPPPINGADLLIIGAKGLNS